MEELQDDDNLQIILKLFQKFQEQIFEKNIQNTSYKILKEQCIQELDMKYLEHLDLNLKIEKLGFIQEGNTI